MDPWESLKVKHVQEIIDRIYGPSTHKVTLEGAWYGLVCCLHSLFLSTAKAHVNDTIRQPTEPQIGGHSWLPTLWCW